MIFVTVGTQLPFDRLVETVDKWVGMTGSEVFAQTGSTFYKPLNLKYSDFLNPSEVEEIFKKATLVVSHAGIGSILSALKYRKPIIIMPRRASLNEHRNEHQLATAKWLNNKSGIHVAWDETELAQLLTKSESLNSSSGMSDLASQELIENLKNFISANK